MQLDALPGDQHRGFGRPRLGARDHRPPRIAAGAGIQGGGGRLDAGAGQRDLHLHIGRLVLQRLEGADDPAELLARAQVFERHREGPFHAAEQIGGGHQRRLVQRQGQRIAHIVGDALRHPRLHLQRAEMAAILGRLGGQPAGIGRLLVQRDPPAFPHRDQEAGGAGRRGEEFARRIRAARHLQRIRLLLPGGQHQRRAGQQRLQRPAADRRQQPGRERRRDQRLRHQCGAQFLGQGAGFAQAQPGAAQRFRHPQADPAHLAHLAEDGGVEARRLEARSRTRLVSLPAGATAAALSRIMRMDSARLSSSSAALMAACPLIRCGGWRRSWPAPLRASRREPGRGPRSPCPRPHPAPPGWYRRG